MTTKKQNQTLQQCLEIVRYATTNGISITESSKTYGFGKNYVSDMKRRLSDRVTKNLVTKTEAKEFNKALKQYDVA